LLARLLHRFQRRSPEPVKVILGLGNPGRQYEATRHNVGWWVLDHLADVWRFDGWRRDGEALTASGQVRANRVRLVKPLTYMNLSGQVLKPYLRRPFWAPKTDLLVVVDDVALPLGRYRLRSRGSSGGHNGLKSVEHHLKSQEYGRLRVGIKPADERREVGQLADFVLSPFGKAERADVVALLPRLTDSVETWLDEGIEAAMNKFNNETNLA
jgi:peptidyl-tRNA hydrolase, PTH1 family